MMISSRIIVSSTAVCPEDLAAYKPPNPHPMITACGIVPAPIIEILAPWEKMNDNESETFHFPLLVASHIIKLSALFC
jgi:hypothetical protein